MFSYTKDLNLRAILLFLCIFILLSSYACAEYKLNVIKPPSVATQTTTGSQRDPALCRCGDDKFVIAWDSDKNIYAQIFYRNGTRFGNEFKVNIISGEHTQPYLAPVGDNSFVVVWLRRVSGDYYIFGQNFTCDGTRKGIEKVLAQQSTSGGAYQNLRFPAIAQYDTNKLILVYECTDVYNWWSSPPKQSQKVCMRRLYTNLTEIAYDGYAFNTSSNEIDYWYPNVVSFADHDYAIVAVRHKMAPYDYGRGDMYEVISVYNSSGHLYYNHTLKYIGYDDRAPVSRSSPAVIANNFIYIAYAGENIYNTVSNDDTWTSKANLSKTYDLGANFNLLYYDKNQRFPWVTTTDTKDKIFLIWGDSRNLSAFFFDVFYANQTYLLNDFPVKTDHLGYFYDSTRYFNLRMVWLPEDTLVVSWLDHDDDSEGVKYMILREGLVLNTSSFRADFQYSSYSLPGSLYSSPMQIPFNEESVMQDMPGLRNRSDPLIRQIFGWS